MRPADTVKRLATFEQRGAGTDAERRTAAWLADQLETPRRTAGVEPFWCRPNRALTHAWHLAVGVAGSLVSVHSPRVGGALLVAALVFVIADDVFARSPGRRLTPEHASQNVTSTPASAATDKLHLIITANYDAGRTGLIYRDGPRRAAAAIRRAASPVLPGWSAWLVLDLAALLAIALLRLNGTHGTLLGVIQVVVTAAAAIAIALLVEAGSAGFGPAASDNASGVAVALALASALDAAPPRHMAVEVVLQGAGDGGGIGLRRHLRARKLKAPDVVVLGIAACGAGSPHWWIGDGPLVPLRYLKGLRDLCAQIAEQQPDLGLRPHRGRGTTPALPARAARLPALAIGCLDRRGLAPRSHQRTDDLTAIDPDSLDAVLSFGLMLVDAIDGYLGEQRAGARPESVPDHGPGRQHMASKRPAEHLLSGARGGDEQL